MEYKLPNVIPNLENVCKRTRIIAYCIKDTLITWADGDGVEKKIYIFKFQELDGQFAFTTEENTYVLLYLDDSENNIDAGYWAIPIKDFVFYGVFEIPKE